MAKTTYKGRDKSRDRDSTKARVKEARNAKNKRKVFERESVSVKE